MRADRLSLRITYLVAAVGLLPSALFVSPFFAVLLVVVLIASAYQDSIERHPLAGWPLNVLAVLGVALAVVIPAPSGPARSSARRRGGADEREAARSQESRATSCRCCCSACSWWSAPQS